MFRATITSIRLEACTKTMMLQMGPRLLGEALLPDVEAGPVHAAFAARFSDVPQAFGELENAQALVGDFFRWILGGHSSIVVRHILILSRFSIR
jgi:hypothetical protein